MFQEIYSYFPLMYRNVLPAGLLTMSSSEVSLCNKAHVNRLQKYKTIVQIVTRETKPQKRQNLGILWAAQLMYTIWSCPVVRKKAANMALNLPAAKANTVIM